MAFPVYHRGMFGAARLLLPALAVLSFAEPAKAFDFFGLFGSSEQPVAQNPQSLPYQLRFKCDGCSSDALALLQDSSSLYSLRASPPIDGLSLSRRTTQDLPKLLDVMWGLGYYNAEIHATIAGVAVSLSGNGEERAASAAEKLRNVALVPLDIEIAPGPLFTIGDVRIFDARSQQPVEAELLPPRLEALTRGAPASAAEIRAAQTQIIDFMRAKSHPLAKVVSLRPAIDHSRGVMDIALSLTPGPRAGIGEVTVSGTKDVDPAVVSSFIYLTRGEDYSPVRLADTRKSIGQIKAIGSARVRDGEALDADGNMPVSVEVTERKPRAIGGNLQYSTVDGPALNAYWEHRNLFGGAEYLRVGLSGGFITNKGQKLNTVDNITGKFSVNFIKPALYGSRNDFIGNFTVAREKTDYYTTQYVDVTAGLRHRFSENFWIQGLAEFEKGQSSDNIGKLNYTLAGLALSGNYDSTDDAIDPKKGFRLSGNLSPYARAFGSTVNLLQSKMQASAYHSFDDEGRYVLAGRVAAGSLMGASIGNIPDNRRFFVGGAGSVRGYAYRSLSPEIVGGLPVGGRSFIEGSLEMRVKLTDTIGIVPFIDAGSAFAASYPDFKQPIHYAAGIGLRYYTAIGPIRLDIARPLNPRPGDRPFAFYLGIGQSF